MICAHGFVLLVKEAARNLGKKVTLTKQRYFLAKMSNFYKGKGATLFSYRNIEALVRQDGGFCYLALTRRGAPVTVSPIILTALRRAAMGLGIILFLKFFAVFISMSKALRAAEAVARKHDLI